MSYLQKFMPKAVQPYASEIVGGTAGYFAWRHLEPNLGVSYGRPAMGAVIGASVGDVVTNGLNKSTAVSNLVGVAAAYMVLHNENKPFKLVRKLRLPPRLGAKVAMIGMPIAAYALGKLVTKKVGL